MNRSFKATGLLLSLILTLLLPAKAMAHALGQSYLFLNVQDDALGVRVEMTIKDLNTALGLSLTTDNNVTDTEISPHLPVILDYLDDKLAIRPNGQPLKADFNGIRLTQTPLGQYLLLQFDFKSLPNLVERVEVDYHILFEQDPDHRGLLVIEHNWKTSTFNNEARVSLIFSPDSTSQQVDLSDSSVVKGVMGMIGSGVHHIWIGIDHILFLIALLLPSVVRREGSHWQSVSSFREALIHVVKIVTVFTIAHSITLSLAALVTIPISSRVVESVIALSIAIAAVDCIRPLFKQRIWWIIFAFGLFHGLGFASVLGALGIPPKYLVHSLLGFNIGVELGQLAIVGAAFPLLYLLSRADFYHRYVLRFGAFALITVSSYWFIERGFEIDLPAGAILNSIVAVFY